MDADPTDDDLPPWGVRLDEPAAAPRPPHFHAPADPDPPRLTLLSREVPGKGFQPRLRLGGDRE